MGRIAARSTAIGAAAGAAMLAFYVAVVRLASGSGEHLRDQVRSDWYLVVAVALAFGVQVALVAELRRRHRLQATSAIAATAGMGASTAGMIACCAHHLVELAPFVGLAGAATFLYDYRLAFVAAGLAVNGVGITLALRRLRLMPRSPGRRHEETQCVSV